MFLSRETVSLKACCSDTVVHTFFRSVAAGDIEIYNEFSLQHEFGIQLRSITSGGCKVQFERPVSFFGLEPDRFSKKEIDIVVFEPDKAEKVAIELKYPRNGQYPEQMYSFCRDIALLEQLVEAGFCAGFFVVVADDPLFYSGPERSGIYAYFRAAQPVHGLIVKPTGKKDSSVEIRGAYPVSWYGAGHIRYAYLAISSLAEEAVKLSRGPGLG